MTCRCAGDPVRQPQRGILDAGAVDNMLNPQLLRPRAPLAHSRANVVPIPVQHPRPVAIDDERRLTPVYESHHRAVPGRGSIATPGRPFTREAAAAGGNLLATRERLLPSKSIRNRTPGGTGLRGRNNVSDVAAIVLTPGPASPPQADPPAQALTRSIQFADQSPSQPIAEKFAAPVTPSQSLHQANVSRDLDTSMMRVCFCVDHTCSLVWT